MAYTLLQLNQLSEVELLTYCENQVDDLVTSTTELALIENLRASIEHAEESISIEYVDDRLEEIQDHLLSDSILEDCVNELDSIINGNLTKAAMLERLVNLWGDLKDVKNEMQGNTETIHSLIREFYEK